MPLSTHFNALRVGAGQGPGTQYGIRGLNVAVAQRYTITPAALATAAVCAIQTVSAAGNLTINGTRASGGTATLDVPRAVTITADGNESGRNFTVTGKDVYGVSLVWTTTGPNAAATTSPKMFKTVTAVAIDTASAGTVAVGMGDRFGLPLRATAFADLDITYNNAKITANTGFSAADATGSAKSGDIRGSYAVQSAADGVKVLDIRIWVSDTDTDSGLFGTAQYAG